MTDFHKLQISSEIKAQAEILQGNDLIGSNSFSSVYSKQISILLKVNIVLTKYILAQRKWAQNVESRDFIQN